MHNLIRRQCRARSGLFGKALVRNRSQDGLVS
jgi:hypothetical protein